MSEQTIYTPDDGIDPRNPQRRCPVVLLLDRSGSMAGELELPPSNRTCGLGC
jgi:uncharacterized protein with von Willebrand factor type A (vWA) domain